MSIVTRLNPQRADPTRTRLQRVAFERDMVRRLRALQREIVQLVAVEDAFGLKKPVYATLNLRSASTQVEITDADVLANIVRIQNSLDPKDVLKLEDNPHITVRYGLDDIGSERVAWIVKQYRSIRVQLGSLSLFENAEETVLKISVTSKDLDNIYRHLGILPNKTTHADYVPHLTIAYLKPGAGSKYLELRSGLEGKELVFDQVLYSDLERNKTGIALNYLVPVTNGPNWQFLTEEQRLQEFMNWLRSQVSITVLAKSHPFGLDDPDHWLTKHIERTYKNGVSRTYDEARRASTARAKRSPDNLSGAKEQFLRTTFSKAPTVQKVKLLASRAFNDLQGVTEAMATQIQRTLVDGFIRGQTPLQIARRLAKDVASIGIARARAIAGTEIVRAHVEAQLDALEELGIDRVAVLAEWVTASGACPRCAPYSGKVFKIKAIRGKIPVHVNCRCSFRIVSRDDTDKPVTRARMLATVERSAKKPRRKLVKR